jgi:hypothetical protein
MSQINPLHVLTRHFCRVFPLPFVSMCSSLTAAAAPHRLPASVSLSTGLRQPDAGWRCEGVASRSKNVFKTAANDNKGVKTNNEITQDETVQAACYRLVQACTGLGLGLIAQTVFGFRPSSNDSNQSLTEHFGPLFYRA